MQVGRTDRFRAGLRESVTFSLKRSDEKCSSGPPLVAYIPERLLGGRIDDTKTMTPWAPSGGLFPLVSETIGNVMFLYTVMAGRAVKVNTQSGEASTIVDFCEKGFFQTNQFGPFPKADAKPFQKNVFVTCLGHP